ncbi:hypothetical protein H310_09253 [Aphanomyces invadans]|uniref:Cell division cycle 5-like protein n=1 Tax=Aphanomyces invadans TaxID=157072 RepID=A0A024TVA7_9STRA|nr:hypothetical protein H310_09253 [Aphanomyces invadans]ETV97938.1 hypothetical protein H310_09253 [Aphanomyces invadans]|eukprot:XP_008873499.1 hypothetical protein H310_09253 [Aphanomyces invadans]
MRILIKGGVWKNTEDEILKAAVMKYGKNQWARVASLLARKSAKQCKARWYEWLDPSIKKTEWSREEEEKLLHLAKLMPSQWRTIAPIVGRTAAQCMEHYEKLLDQAQKGADGDDTATDDPRRLRPGEIDPNPENKPARPDPVDMDEDEKEMLSEARARLANTKGKKAKRKAREKQLQEAKRLASLQKRRELKAAGITPDKSKQLGNLRKKRKFIDYVKEIPFEKKVPAGFYDTSAERSSAVALDPKQTALYLNQLEGVHRDAEEKRARREDAKRQKKLLSSALPQQIAAINKLNDPSSFIKRKALDLPAPMVTNDELGLLAKQGASDVAQAQMLALEHSTSQQSTALVTVYNPLATPGGPAATPAHAGQASQTPQMSVRETIMQEAANLAAMTRAATPLLGGDNVDLQQGTGYGGITPSRTPGPSSVLRTPSSSLRTPMRDMLGINPDVGDEITDMSKRAEKARHRAKTAALQSGFASLPEAQLEYEISLPAVDAPTADEDSGRVEDAGERDARLAREAAAEADKALLRRSTVFQKQLPKPTSTTSLVLNDDPAIQDELAALLAADVGDGSKKKRKRGQANAPSSDVFTNDELQLARNLVALDAKLHGAGVLDVNSTWQAAQKNIKELAPGQLVHWDDISVDLRIQLLSKEFAALKEVEAKLVKKADKLEQKAGLLHGGYENVCAGYGTSLETTHQAWLVKSRELHAFNQLRLVEQLALPRRLESLGREVDLLQLREVELQKRYAALLEETDAIAAES